MTIESQHLSRHRGPRLTSIVLTGVLALAGATVAQVQPTISINYRGPSGSPSGGPLDPGAAYRTTPSPAPPVPALIAGSGPLGIAPVAFRIGELDALSWGRDTQLQPNSTLTGLRTVYRLVFSTDNFANGHPALGAPSDLRSEGTLGNQEASADLQMAGLTPTMGLPPWGPLSPFIGHNSWLDGNGVAPFGGLGIGLVEPNLPMPGILANLGDTVDAVDFRGPQAVFSSLYFSLDGSSPDLIEGIVTNIGTAAANGVNPGDVLVSSILGGGFIVWAQAAQLGLSPGDDLDALVLWENGDGIFTPSVVPFDWTVTNRDMLLFSVRRGSPLIGSLDANFSIPIAEGDILTTPPGGPGTPPGIFIAAETIGLATIRSGTVAVFPFNNDLNALSIR